MKSLWAVAASAMVFILGAMNLSEARADLITHVGTNDPLTEGWATLPSPPNVNTVLTAAPNDQPGINAWNIKTDNSGFVYKRNLTANELTAATANGWTLEANYRIQDENTHPSYMLAMFQTTTKIWFVEPIINGSSLDIQVGYNANNDHLYHGFTPGYHDYKFVYHADTQLADFSVDGQVILANFSGDTATAHAFDNSVDWGAPATGAYGNGTFSLVRFDNSAASIPEPSSLLLSGVAALGMAAVAWRRRSRSTLAANAR